VAALVPARGDDAADARALIDKAMKAAGGKDKLAKLKAQTWKEKGTYYGMGEGLPYTANFAVQWPDKFRFQVEGVFTVVLDGDKGWLNAGGETREMTKDELANKKQSNYAGYVTTLVPLDDKSFTLTTLPESKVDGKPALGVKVAKKGMPDVSLYFDKATGLLVKSGVRTKAEEMDNKEVNQEAYYSDFRDVDGVKVPEKIVVKRDDKLYIEAKNSDVKMAEKLDDKVFAKP
jgi:hypothetical protein